jgi:hypothetical protein
MTDDTKFNERRAAIIRAKLDDLEGRPAHREEYNARRRAKRRANREHVNELQHRAWVDEWAFEQH